MTEELKPKVTKPLNGRRAAQRGDQELNPQKRASAVMESPATFFLYLSLSLSLSLFFPHGSLSNLTNRQSKVTKKIGEQQSRIEHRNRERKSSGGTAKIRRKSKSLKDSKR
ncbi:hypothetical protein M9H77_05206 [Catharanthus roseus]|uniref:Uncharacterized protein n=1 Tax=Catharanthus roseus TaxID=4058 RepID=A0ACC0CGA1_CATRO|nr:hypothetical protein M9H77_05206 [Catharanthus roseus]